MGIQGKIDVPSVIDKIFYQRQRAFHRYIFLPNLRLYPFLFVCRDWHAIAERRIYASVSLGGDKTVFDEDGDEIELEGEEVCEMFLDTVSSNSRLASLVHELRLGTKDHSKNETEMHIELINRCKHVERVEIQGYNGHVLNELKNALKKKKEKLTSLRVSRYGLRDREGDTFCSVSELLSYMRKWPRLQKIYMENNTLQSYGDEEVHEDDEGQKDGTKSAVFGPEEPSYCPVLKEFTVRECRLRNIHLKRLEKMAPNLQQLELHVSSNTAAALARCIGTWSSTLKHLNLHVHGETSCSLASVSSGLTELRYLRVSSNVIPPSAFVNFNKLEAAMYHASAEHAKELTSIVRRKGTLPAMKILTCDRIFDHEKGVLVLPARSTDKKFTEAIKDLREACQAKKLTFSASFMEEEESRFDLEGVRDSDVEYGY